MRKVCWWVAGALVAWGMAETARAATIRGRVLAADGTPAVGAKVWAVKVHFQDAESHEVRADADGRFAIEVEPSPWMIEATQGDQGAANAIQVQVATEEFDPNPITIRLKPQSRLRGRLIEAETGRPIAGGRFVLDNGEVPVSDGDGRFEVSGLHRATHHEAFVVAPRRERRRVLFELSERSVTDLEVAVPRGGRAVGLVLDPDGRPIPRAAVGRPFGGQAIAQAGLWTRTDEKGRFVYDGLRPGQTTWLTTSADGFVATQRHNIRTGPNAEPTALLFRLDRVAAPQATAPQEAPAPQDLRNVAGVVTDSEGVPVAGVVVRWGFNRAPGVAETRTDAAGKFQFVQVPNQLWIITLYTPGLDLAPTATAIQPNGNQDVQIQLPRGRTYSGIVRDDAGAPLPLIKVTPMIVRANEWTLMPNERTVETDAQGRFALAGLPDANVQANFFTNEEAWDVYGQPLAFDKKNLVTMMATGLIRGRVVDEAGRPVRNFRVVVSVPRDRKPDESTSNIDPGIATTGLTFTADDGSFQIGNLTAGTSQRITVLAEGRGAASIDRVIALPRHRPAPDPLPTFRLGPTHALTVRVADQESRAPIPNARVSLISDGPGVDQTPDWTYADWGWNDSVHADADEAGLATFSSLAFDEATVLVQLPGYPKRHVGWRDGAGVLEVLIQPEAVLTGEILDQKTARPLEDVFVSLNSPASGNFNASLQPGGEGRFRFGDLREGVHTLSVAKLNLGTIHEETIILKPGERRQLTLRLDPWKGQEDPMFVPIR